LFQGGTCLHATHAVAGIFGYWLTFADVAASSISSAVSFGWRREQKLASLWRTFISLLLLNIQQLLQF
jgi:hypothetical protein